MPRADAQALDESSHKHRAISNQSRPSNKVNIPLENLVGYPTQGPLPAASPDNVQLGDVGVGDNPSWQSLSPHLQQLDCRSSETTGSFASEATASVEGRLSSLTSRPASCESSQSNCDLSWLDLNINASSLDIHEEHCLDNQDAFKDVSYEHPDWVISLLSLTESLSESTRSSKEDVLDNIAQYFCAARSYTDAFELYHLILCSLESRLDFDEALKLSTVSVNEVVLRTISAAFNCARTATTPSQRCQAVRSLRSLHHRDVTGRLTRLRMSYLAHLYLGDMDDVLGESNSKHHVAKAMENPVYQHWDGQGCSRFSSIYWKLSISNSVLPGAFEVTASEHRFSNRFSDLLVEKHLLEYKGDFRRFYPAITESISGRVSGYTIFDFQEAVAHTPFWKWCSQSISASSEDLDAFIAVPPKEENSEKDFINTVLFCHFMESWMTETSVPRLAEVLKLSGVNPDRFSIPESLAAASFIITKSSENPFRTGRSSKSPAFLAGRIRKPLSISNCLLSSIVRAQEESTEYSFDSTVCDRPPALHEVSVKALRLFASRLVNNYDLISGRNRPKKDKLHSLAPNAMDFQEYSIRPASLSTTLLSGRSSSSLWSRMSISTGRTRPLSSGGSMLSRRSSTSFTHVTGLPHGPPPSLDVEERAADSNPPQAELGDSTTVSRHDIGTSYMDWDDDSGVTDAMMVQGVGTIHEDTEDQDMEDGGNEFIFKDLVGMTLEIHI